MKKPSLYLSALILSFVTLMTACGGGGGGGSTSDTTSSTVGASTSGTASSASSGPVVQKGPFIRGSQISIYALDGQLNPTGSAYSTQTTDDTGSFSLSFLPASVQYIEIVADGFYLDEVTGQLSAARVLLRTIEDVRAHQSISINVLTTLQEPRIRALVNSGKSFEDAFVQSQDEVLAAFGIPTAGLARTTLMRIDGQTDSDAILLAASAILLKMAHNSSATRDVVPAQLAALLDQIAQDIGADGALDSAAVLSAKATASQGLDLSGVRSNVRNFYAAKGISFEPPLFEEWVDNDGSTLLPKRRSVPVVAFSFTPVTDADALTTYTSNAVTVAGLGGLYGAAWTESNSTIVKNGVALPGSYTTVVDGDNIAVRTTSAGFGKTTKATLRVGSTTADFTLTTRTTHVRFSYNFQYDVPIIINTGDQTGPYFAIPIRTSDALTARYIGMGTYVGNSVAVSLYTDDAGKPGSPLGSAVSAGHYFETTTYPMQPRDLTYQDRQTLNQNWQAFFGHQGIPLSGATNYWVVIRQATVGSFAFNHFTDTSCHVWSPLPHASMLYSADGSSWSTFGTWPENPHTYIGWPNVGPAIYISD